MKDLFNNVLFYMCVGIVIGGGCLYIGDNSNNDVLMTIGWVFFGFGLFGPTVKIIYDYFKNK